MFSAENQNFKNPFFLKFWTRSQILFNKIKEKDLARKAARKAGIEPSDQIFNWR